MTTASPMSCGTTATWIPILGIDPEDNALVLRLSCEHSVGYPLGLLDVAYEAGAGVGLLCPSGCSEQFIMPAEVREIVAHLDASGLGAGGPRLDASR